MNYRVKEMNLCTQKTVSLAVLVVSVLSACVSNMPQPDEAKTPPELSTLSMPSTDQQSMPAMDHSAMSEMDHSKMPGMNQEVTPTTDHDAMSGMNHDTMTGMDHSKMPGIDQDAIPAMDHDAMSGMNHNAMPGMDHSTMSDSAKSSEHDMANMPSMSQGTMRMQGGPAPANARDPHAYADGYDFGPIPRPRMADEHNFGSLMFDRLEGVHSSDNTSATYDLKAWYGRDYDRAVFKAEGDYDNGELEEASTELLWSHAVTAYWNTQLGVRYDSGEGPNRSWLAFGVQGLAPYWFEVDTTAYIGEEGRFALNLEAEYELLLTQKLILQPRIEADYYSKDDSALGIGTGLSEFAAGIRLRYEIRRELAPYVGIERVGKFGGTADYAHDAGMDAKETRAVAGLRFWF